MKTVLVNFAFVNIIHSRLLERGGGGGGIATPANPPPPSPDLPLAQLIENAYFKGTAAIHATFTLTATDSLRKSMNKDLQQIREDMRKSDHSTREELHRMNGLLCNVLDKMKRLSASFSRN